jgi:hypothetical protein
MADSTFEHVRYGKSDGTPVEPVDASEILRFREICLSTRRTVHVRPPLGPGQIAKYEHELAALDGLGLQGHRALRL